MIPRRWINFWLIGSGWMIERYMGRFHPVRSSGPTPGFTPWADTEAKARWWIGARVYWEDRQ